MFSLIITFISIALVAMLALTSIYFGGDKFFTYNAKASAAQLSSETEQIKTAIQMYMADHSKLPTSFSDLTKDGVYLRNAPERWESSSQYFSKGDESLSQYVCAEFNVTRGVPFIPNCSDEAYREVVVCCQDDITPPQ